MFLEVSDHCCIFHGEKTDNSPLKGLRKVLREQLRTLNLPPFC